MSASGSFQSPYSGSGSPDLQKLQKHRIALYKQHLKEEIDKHSKQRNEENSYIRKKQLTNVNELIERLNSDDVRRLQERKNLALILKEDNEKLYNIKKEDDLSFGEDGQMLNNSFIDQINIQDKQRNHRLRQIYANNYHDNEAHEQIKRNVQQRTKSLQKQDQQRHLRRLKQMQWQRAKNYQNIKSKHNQNMDIYGKHQKLMQINDQYRKMAQKFTQCDEDIISRLKRNQSAQRKRVYRSNQQVLKNQMGEYQQRRSLEKSQILEGNNIDQSIFKNLLHGSPNYKKQYGLQLRNQMQQAEIRKSGQKIGKNQKYQIGGIYGGEHGRERHRQIEYVDRKLGINALNKSKQLGYQLQRQSVNNNNEQDRKQNPERRTKSNLNTYQQNQHNQLKRQTNQGNKVFQQKSEQVRRSSLQFPIARSISQTLDNNPQAHPLGNVNQIQYRHVDATNTSSPNMGGPNERKLFRSFDLLTNQARYYG